MKKIAIALFLIAGLLTNKKEKMFKETEEIKGIFISYIELQEYVKRDNIQESKNNINKMIENINQLKINTIILQVRANCDAIYDSEIFPYSIYISQEEGKKTYDVLKYFIEESHKKNIKVIAWINPYRIRTTENIKTITEKSPAYQYLNTDTVYIKNGIYWNPSKKEVEEIIINGVKEVLNYKVDGILFDDYFYPDNEIDIKDYEKIRETESITLQEYHLRVINQMIEKVHNECQEKNVKFGISPDGNIENNYQKNYADVKTWMGSSNYLDFIMPQLYYGFYNSTKAYSKVIKEWESLLKTEKVDLLVALAFYKVGKEDAYAKEGRKEWIENDDIIMREVLLSRNLKNYKGFSLFRYDSIFKEDEYTLTSRFELENLKKIIK